MRRRRYNLAALALVLLGIAVAAMTVLHLRQTSSSIVQQPLSFYVHGRHGWLLPLALAAFGGATMVLGILFRRSLWLTGTAGWLIWFGIGMLVAATAPADRWFPWEGPISSEGVIHAAAAVLAPPLLLGAMAEVRRRRSEFPASLQVPLDALTLAYVAGLTASGLSLLSGFVQRDSPPWIGLAERILALAAVGWLAIIACAAGRRQLPTLAPTQGPDEGGIAAPSG